MPVTLALAAGCLVVSLATLARPDLYGALGGLRPLSHPWQPATAAFEHGFDGVPLVAHLAGNLVLLWATGRIAEPLLGSLRYACVTALAIACFALALLVGPVDGHGASSFIYAYPPVLLAARIYAKATNDPGALAVTGPVNALLVLMWGVVPALMAIIPYAVGWRGGIFEALVLGNLFHLTGTAAGAAGAWMWRGEIARRLAGPQALMEPGDRLAAGASVLLPVALVAIVAVAAG